jgi:hypothetical protein
LRPVVSKARHLVAAEITRKRWNTLRDGQDERIWLFRPSGKFLRHERVKAYLRLKIGAGGARRTNYKIRTRSPWYRTPLKERVDGFISGMTVRGPWIALRRMPTLNATNTLYTVRFKASASLGERAGWALSLLSSWTREQMAQAGRRYADGLLKFEPGEMHAIPLRVPSRTRGALTAYRRAISFLLAGDEAGARKIADAWLNGPAG